MHLARIPWIGKVLFRAALSRMDTKGKKAVYLTFDDGPIPEVTPLVLDILKKYDAKATFFCVGDNVKKHPQIFQQLLSDGHRLGNHTFNHMDGWKNSDDRYIENVNKCVEVLSSYLFRPPYGRIKYSQYRKLKKRFKIVLWDVLSWDFDAKLSADECLDIVKKNTRAGSILVFHDSVKTKDKIGSLLTGTLEFIKREGYEIKPL